MSDVAADTEALHGSPGGLRPREASNKVPLFGARKRARALAQEIDRLREAQERLGILSVVELEKRKEELEAEIPVLEGQLAQQRADAAAVLEREAAEAERERARLADEVASLRQSVVVTEETALLQEVGIYEYRHPLTGAAAYQDELKRLREQIKLMARKDGGAVLATTNWTVNNSASKGRAMVRDFSKLMLRAYNAEGDNLVRGLKPYKLDSAVDRLTKVTQTIAKLGKTMDIRISDAYHRLRVRELELTADYVEKLAQEKEREREERERLREERRVQQEMERERARLEKERQHYLNALEALIAKGDEEGAARLREQLADVDRAIEDVDYRAANIRAGYVYVISNVGSFGTDVIKVGMTRRLEPLDRVRELGDASVPFRFDVHALFFSDDAVGIESRMHQRLADRRINRVNLRREFFRATPSEVRGHLLELTGELLQFEDAPEALEYHQSVTEAQLSGGA
jgi:hypothetical protein